MDKLRLKKGDKLVISEKHDGFVVCKIEDYTQNWMDKFDMEWRELDMELKQMFAKHLNRSDIQKKQEEDKAEVL